MVHAFIAPEDTDATDGENIHILKATKVLDSYNLDSNETYCKETTQRKTAKCGKDTDNDARNFAATLENGGKKVCGVCVSHLYGDKK